MLKYNFDLFEKNRFTELNSIFELLRKIISISFLFLFLSANTEIHQLLRLPMMLHHFLEHQEHESDETFADFLDEHYSEHHTHSENEHHDNDHDHDDLPFKTASCSTAHILMDFVSHIQFSFPRPTIFYTKISPIHSVGFYFSAALNNIWQPPKIS